MAHVNVLVSNGTCYSSANELSYEDYIPCGNAASGQHYPCCSKGDTCLSNNACFNNEYGNTYLSGCTDQSYKAGACPDKGDYGGQQWVGLVTCDDSHNDKRAQKKEEEWYGCEEDPDIPYVNPGNRNCTCSSQAPLFTDGAVLSNLATLPVASGGTIKFVSGHIPPTVVSPAPLPTNTGDDNAATTSEALGGTPTATNGTPTAAVTTSSGGGGSGLSTGAMAGLGAGAGLGAVLFIALIYLALRYRRLQAKKAKSGYEGLHPSPAGTGTPGTTNSPGDNHHHHHHQYHANGSTNYDDKASPDTATATATTADIPIHSHPPPPHHHYHHNGGDGSEGGVHGCYKAELAADNNYHHHHNETIPSPHLTQQQQQQQEQEPRQYYYAYNPDRYGQAPPLSAISERSNETMMMNSPVFPRISPQSTGETGAAAAVGGGGSSSSYGTQHGQGHHGQSQRSGGGNMEPIYEMQA